MTPEALECARIVFDFLQLRHQPITADVMLVFGTNDMRVPEFAAELYHRGYSKTVVITGGMAHQHDLLATSWTRPEAQVFADILVERGVPREHLMLECRATNTAENVRFSRHLLEENRMFPRNLLMVSKPFMQRRVLATYVVEWPEIAASVASWATTFDDYCTRDLDPEKVTNIMMGDLQRVWIYGKRGWSAPQKIPESVMQAYGQLAELGFTRHLLCEE
jgi:uncharacterized SAM-binding protein YcdF (DUF218 family)